MTIPLLHKHPLFIGNRDGNAYVVETVNRQFYLVLEADSFHVREVFQGMGSTQQTRISAEAFAALVTPQGRAASSPDRAASGRSRPCPA